MMTQKQRDLLEFIQKRLDRDGVPPSFDEMRIALDLKSKSGIHRLITALEERGFIRRLAHRARAIEIVKLPDAMNTGSPVSISTSSVPSFSEAQAKRDAELIERHPTMGEVPMMGHIAAGVPIEAIQHATHDVGVPLDMIGSGEHYALEVRGDSMIDAGIHDGDTVIIKNQSTADNGDIVVALVEDQEATLKRFRRKGNAIALEAANPAYETRLFRSDQLKIQGKLVGLIRSY